VVAYEELKKRVPEPEEEMTGEEALNYFKDKTKKKKTLSWNRMIVNDIFNRTRFRTGKILDVGFGSGGLMRELKKHNPSLQLVGVDASKTLLEAAKKISDLDLRYCRAENLKFKDENFDLVVCQDTFHHFKKPIQVLKEMFRVTKKGGYIYITDLRRDSDKQLILNGVENIAKGSLSHTIYYLQSVKASYTSREIKSLVKEAGIKKYKIFSGHTHLNIRKLIMSIQDPQKRKDKERLFKERWILIIQK
jgi:ubiquinone/menaquinone biosynthesis C-methylase UbiE